MFKKKTYNTLTDEELMQHIQKGKVAAFDALYARYSRRMFAFFYKMLWQNDAKANDFTQELFLKIIEKPHSFDTQRNFSTWIYTLAHNLCKNEYRKQDNKNRVMERQAAQQARVENPKNDLDENTFQKDLNAALEKLPEAHRTCFLLRYKDELTISEMSKILNCPEGTIKSRLFYAAKKLSKLLKDWESFSFKMMN